MNQPFTRWLLDLESIPADADTLHLAWERAWPGWIWLILAVLCAWFATWSYTRLSGRRGLRGVLAVVRAAIIILVLVILSGPMLELRRESVEEDWVLVIADRSQSLTIADAEGRRTREAQLRDVLTRNQGAFDALRADRELRWLGFHTGAFTIDPANLGDPTGVRTDLSAALEQALQRAAARPVSGIILLTDGRTSSPPDRSLLRRLQAEAIGVYPVPLGSPDPLGDLAVRRVDAPRRAFVRDKVPVAVEIDRFGSAVRDYGGRVRLVDELTGETLDEVELQPGDDQDVVTLTAVPELVGEANWVVEIVTDENDLVPENNARSVLIELVDRPLRVLFIDGYPRWDYRYLKNLIVREESIDSSVMLLSADRNFAQEGNAPITRLPRSPEEFAAFDVIVIGDVPATFFSPDQLDLIRSHVAERGAGLLWIGGERHTPDSYTGLALADLLPMRGPLNLPAIEGPVNLEPTELAERLGVLQIVKSDASVGWPVELRDPSYNWSRLWYAQHIDPARLKPTAEVLATTAFPVDGVELPLVIHMRYGAGQSIYVATDEIWRWRYGRGEFYPDQFWIQMVRMLGRESLETAGDRAVLEVNPRRTEVGAPVRLSLRLLDQQLIEQERPSIRVAINEAGSADGGDAVTAIELRRSSSSTTLGGTSGEYVATYIPERTGIFDVRVDDPTFTIGEQLFAPLEVYGRDDELRRPETDHALLASLATETGGRVLDPNSDDLATLELPNREVRTENPLRERIWDTPLFFGLLLILLTLEWIGRKVLKLV